jgi:hypothetical protein
MVEDIGKIIRNGFETFTKNLNLSIPFVLNTFITGLVAVIMFVVGFFLIFGPVLSSFERITTPEGFMATIVPFLAQHILEIAIVIIISFVIILFLATFFTAGAIGMAKQATENGKTELSAMIEAGKKNVLNLFLAEVLVGLLSLAGIVFLVPGAMKFNLAQLQSPENIGSFILLAGGLLLWVLYLLILNIVLGPFRYALVVDNLGPIEGIMAGFNFFNKHKMDVILLYLVTIAVGIIFGIINQIIGRIPVISIFWFFISLGINVIVISPIFTVWWIRLYMERMGRKIYFNELLAHPNDPELENP